MTPPQPSATGPTPPASPPPTSALGRLDAWMAENPWHPRATPFFVYMVSMLAIQMLTGGSFGLPELPAIVPALYTLQCGLVVFLLWRYRKLIPELNLKFHWLAIPTGVGLLFAWVYLGYMTNWLSYQLKDVPIVSDVASFFVSINPDDPRNEQATSSFTDGRASFGDAWYWTSLSLRLLGMSLVVPLFEELWVRSAVLRGMFDPRKTWTAILQLASDLPIIGEPIGRSEASRRAAQAEPMFTRQLEENRVGQISLFAIIASTLVFMLAHQPRDYMGCIACGVVWCGLVWWTNKPNPRKGETWDSMPAGGRYGLGPIAWSHGITNATLWAWTLWTGDWQFL